ncbi:hypothetical protein [Hymenobacter sp. YC55]|uniref:hypothetical protein n=1 Tax=Hymenobacter sp. YC55 TaxID=3034019 RepID=UPI0023F6F00A|nr:hypothetical protein [Hymenobacter sp. YC55]MDF7815920.1 hypothetical protein [Hymenobacter sp. YC55]
MKRLLVLLLAAASVLLLIALVYALNFAKPDSTFSQYRVLIGFSFMAVTRFALRAYRRSRIGHS